MASGNSVAGPGPGRRLMAGGRLLQRRVDRAVAAEVGVHRWSAEGDEHALGPVLDDARAWLSSLFDDHGGRPDLVTLWVRYSAAAGNRHVHEVLIKPADITGGLFDEALRTGVPDSSSWRLSLTALVWAELMQHLRL